MKFEIGDLVYCMWPQLTGLAEVVKVDNGYILVQCLNGSADHGLVCWVQNDDLVTLNEI
jgi:hypothetical protein